MTPRSPHPGRRLAAAAIALGLLAGCGSSDTATPTTESVLVGAAPPTAADSAARAGRGRIVVTRLAVIGGCVDRLDGLDRLDGRQHDGGHSGVHRRRADDGIAIAAAQVAVDAKAYGVFDLSGDRWLAGDGIDTPLAVGSIMKLLTALVVMQAGDPERVVTVPELQLDPMESAIGLYTGEQLPRDVLLRAMLIVSANDAARVLARDVGGDEPTFVSMMNAAAQQLGLTGTVAANPTGLDQGDARSTVRDVVRLSSVLLQDGAFNTTVARTSARLHGAEIPASNDLLTLYQGADGIKTGTTTNAGHCLAASATRDGRRIVVVVLGSSSDEGRVAAASALLDWAFAQPAG